MEAVTVPLIASNLEQLEPPAALCCPSLMAPGPLFESEYILGSTAFRSRTVMDCWPDGWLDDVGEIAEELVSFLFLKKIPQCFPWESQGSCAAFGL